MCLKKCKRIWYMLTTGVMTERVIEKMPRYYYDDFGDVCIKKHKIDGLARLTSKQAKKRMLNWLYANNVCDAESLIGLATKTEVMRRVSMDTVVAKYLFYNKMQEDIEFVF